MINSYKTKEEFKDEIFYEGDERIKSVGIRYRVYAD